MVFKVYHIYWQISICLIVQIIKRRNDYETTIIDGIDRSHITGDTVFVPAGTWHNVWNTGSEPLKLSSIYAPPNHPRGTYEENKQQ